MEHVLLCVLDSKHTAVIEKQVLRVRAYLSARNNANVSKRMMRELVAPFKGKANLICLFEAQERNDDEFVKLFFKP